MSRSNQGHAASAAWPFALPVPGRSNVGIEAEHYPNVGGKFLGAIKDVMGDGATDEIIQAVCEAYSFLADIFIGREDAIYHSS